MRSGDFGREVELIDWPPDLNPIEHVWAGVKPELDKRYPGFLDPKPPRWALRKRIEEASIIHC